MQKLTQIYKFQQANQLPVAERDMIFAFYPVVWTILTWITLQRIIEAGIARLQ